MSFHQQISNSCTTKVNQSGNIVSGTYEKHIKYNQSGNHIARLNGWKQKEHNRHGWVHVGKSDHHTKYRTGRPDHHTGSVKKRKRDMEKRSANTGSKKYHRKCTRPKPLFYRPAHPPEPEHIKKQMKTTSVQKHIGYKSPRLCDSCTKMRIKPEPVYNKAVQ